MNDKFYKDFYQAAEQCLDKDKFEWILKFMEMKKLKDKMDFPELYRALEEVTMNRLEEIKDKLRRYDETDYSKWMGPDAVLVMEGTEAEDIRYLLQRLERYETALKDFTDKHFTGGSKSNRDDYVAFGVTTADIYKLKEALQE